LVFEQFLPVHRLTLLDIQLPRRQEKSMQHFPKVEEFPDYLFVVVNPLSPHFTEPLAADAEIGPPARHGALLQLSAVLTRRVLITHHYEAVPPIDQLRNYLDKHQTQCGRGPDFLFHLILDDLVNQFAPVLDRVHAALDRLEAQVFANPMPQILTRLMRLKRRIILVRKTLVYEREVVARLARGDFALIDEREMVYYRNVYDHLVRFAELIEGAREMATDLMQTHLAATSNRLNEIMKVLTMISTVVLPMTLVAGIFGMNFKHMPELEWTYGYPMALGLMALTGVTAYFLFRWRKWM
jgi:magnesium transporter